MEDVEEEVVEGNVVDELEIEADPIVPEPVLTRTRTRTRKITTSGSGKASCSNLYSR